MSKMDELKQFIKEGQTRNVLDVQFQDEDCHAEYFTVELKDQDGKVTTNTYKITKGDGGMIEEGEVWSQKENGEDWFYEGYISSDL